MTIVKVFKKSSGGRGPLAAEDVEAWVTRFPQTSSYLDGYDFTTEMRS
jgi:hypothetical protein